MSRCWSEAFVASKVVSILGLAFNRHGGAEYYGMTPAVGFLRHKTSTCHSFAAHQQQLLLISNLLPHPLWILHHIAEHLGLGDFACKHNTGCYGLSISVKQATLPENFNALTGIA